MIKRIIFDVDDTLIDFPKEYLTAYQGIASKYNLKITPYDLYAAISKYELKKDEISFTKEGLLLTINNELNLNLDINFIDDFLYAYNNLKIELSNEVKETLDYLSHKYELVILSNWFTDSQKIRLEKAGILKYFVEVYGADIVSKKPNKDSYLSAMNGYKPEECFMIGDNLDMDIKIPYSMGINVFHLSKEKKGEYPTINKIEELRKVL